MTEWAFAPLIESGASGGARRAGSNPAEAISTTFHQAMISIPAQSDRSLARTSSSSRVGRTTNDDNTFPIHRLAAGSLVKKREGPLRSTHALSSLGSDKGKTHALPSQFGSPFHFDRSLDSPSFDRPLYNQARGKSTYTSTALSFYLLSFTHPGLQAHSSSFTSRTSARKDSCKQDV
jgi:hypothetical protein